MKPEIKQRIEQIRRGEVPEGYKKSPFGILPIDWKIKKLSDVLIKQTRKNKDNSVHNVLTNSATQGIISQIDYFDKKIANDENTNGYYLVQTGDFVYNPRISNNAPCGPFNRYNGNKNGIMSPLYTVYRFEDKSLVYSDYLSQYFLSSKWHAYMNGIANYGARSDRMNVLSEDMDNMPLPYPSSCEQQRIVEILSTQDKVIELYEKKIEQLQLLKKICLKKMFPRQGRNVPEVRFPGFTEPWELRKIIDVCDYVDYRGKTPTKTQAGIFLVTAKNIKDGYIDYECSKEYISENDYEEVMHRGKPLVGDVLFTTEAPCGNVAQVNNENIAIAQRIIKYCGHKNIIHNTFFKYYLLSPDFQSELSSKCTGGTVQGIKGSVLHQQIVKFPKFDEQIKIKDFLESLDYLITLQQRTCDEEKRKKNALMQLLLTGIVRVEK